MSMNAAVQELKDNVARLADEMMAIEQFLSVLGARVGLSPNEIEKLDNIGQRIAIIRQTTYTIYVPPDHNTRLR